MGSDYGDSAEVMKAMVDAAGVKLEQVAITGMEATFSVVTDGKELGRVTFGKYYEPRLQAMDPYVAFWAGATLCVIDRHYGTLLCIDRDDETHRIHPFEGAWIVEGELNIDLFDPTSGKMLATYHHNEVITDSSLVAGFVEIRDFYGATVTLDAHHSLQVVRSSKAVVVPHESNR